MNWESEGWASALEREVYTRCIALGVEPSGGLELFRFPPSMCPSSPPYIQGGTGVWWLTVAGCGTWLPLPFLCERVFDGLAAVSVALDAVAEGADPATLGRSRGSLDTLEESPAGATASGGEGC